MNTAVKRYLMNDKKAVNKSEVCLLTKGKLDSSLAARGGSGLFESSISLAYVCKRRQSWEHHVT